VQNLPVDVQNAGFEPFPNEVKKGPVVDPQLQHLQQPVMVEVIEEAFDVGFDDVTELAKLEVETEVLDRCLGTSPRPVAIADGQKVLLVDGVQDLGAGKLHQLVFQGGYPQRPLAAVLFGDVAAPDQLGPVAFGLQALHQMLQVGVEVLLVRLGCHAVDSAGGFLVQIAPAVSQQLGIQTSVEILKTMVFAGARPLGYSPQGG
jgi:hypothetical protein